MMLVTSRKPGVGVRTCTQHEKNNIAITIHRPSVPHRKLQDSLWKWGSNRRT